MVVCWSRLGLHNALAALSSPSCLSLQILRGRPRLLPSSCKLTPDVVSTSLQRRSFLHNIPFSICSSMAYPARSSSISSHSESNVPETGVGGGGGGGFSGSGGSSGGHNDQNYSSNGGDGAGDGSAKKSFISWYMNLLNSHPVATKAITSALLTLFGDLFCQLVIEKSEAVAWKRTGMFTLLGLVLVGPTLHYWYLNLSKMLPGPGAVKAGLRLVLDQFVFSPVFIGVFFSALLTLEGRTSEIAPKLQQDWFSAVVANWKIWIPFQFLNFLFVPQQLQVLAANVIALAWNVYLSFATHKHVMPPVERK